jgi:hypothetical protein
MFAACATGTDRSSSPAFVCRAYLDTIIKELQPTAVVVENADKASAAGSGLASFETAPADLSANTITASPRSPLEPTAAISKARSTSPSTETLAGSEPWEDIDPYLEARPYVQFQSLCSVPRSSSP